MIINKFFINISASFFFYFASIGVYIIFLPKMLSDIGYSSFQIGVIFAIIPLMRFLTPFFFLKKIKLNQKLFIIASFTNILGVFSFFFTIYNFYLFTLSNILFGIGMSLVLPYIETISITKLKESYGKSRLYGSIGFMLISLILARILTLELGLIYLFISVIFIGIFGFLVSNQEIKDENIEDNSNFSLKIHWQLWISVFLMQVAFGAFYNFFTIYATEQNISLEVVSYLWAFGVICEIIMLNYQTPLLKKFSPIVIIKITLLITVFRWLLLYLFPTSLTIYFISQTFHAFSFALYHSATLSYIYNIYQNKKLANQFFYGISYGLGGFLGALIAGKFYGEYLFLSSATITLLAYLVLKGK